MAKDKKVEAVEAVEEAVSEAFPAKVPVKTKYGVPCFYVVTVGNEARVYGKRGEAISPVISVGEASKLATRFNALDAEQIEARNRPAPAKNPLAEAAALEDR